MCPLWLCLFSRNEGPQAPAWLQDTGSLRLQPEANTGVKPFRGTRDVSYRTEPLLLSMNKILWAVPKFGGTEELAWTFPIACERELDSL